MMFAVTVTFLIKPGRFAAFMPLMRENAQISLRDEPDCHQFDICTDLAQSDQVFLYELYSDASAFQQHLDSDHFKAFDAEVSTMIAAKDVRTFGEVHQ